LVDLDGESQEGPPPHLFFTSVDSKGVALHQDCAIFGAFFALDEGRNAGR